jgi:hypothetical protein
MAREGEWKWPRIVPAVPLFGLSSSPPLVAMPLGEPSPGVDLLQAKREGGLMGAIAASHVIIGIGLLLQRARFPGAPLQFPMSPGAMAEPARLRSLPGTAAAR